MKTNVFSSIVLMLVSVGVNTFAATTQLPLVKQSVKIKPLKASALSNSDE